MIIKNFKELITNPEKRTGLEILEEGLFVAMPHLALKKIIQKNRLLIGNTRISLSKYDRIFVIALGKAADYMATSISSLIHVNGGIIVIPSHNHSILKNKKFEIFHAGHPIPNKQSIHAAKKIIKFLKERDGTDFVIFLISGGSSSLVALPDGISLYD